MIFSYRSGKNPVSRKAWRKLEAAERAAGIGEAAKVDESRQWYGQQLQSATPAEREAMQDPLLAQTWVRAMEAALDCAAKGNREEFREMLRITKEAEPRGRRAFFRLIRLAERRGELAAALKGVLAELD